MENSPLSPLPSVESSQKKTKATEREAGGAAIPDGTAPSSSLPSVKTGTPAAHEGSEGQGAKSTEQESSAPSVISPFSLLLLTLAALLLVRANAPFYNRSWNALMVVPDDLAMSHVIADFGVTPLDQINVRVAPRLLTTPGIGIVAQATGARNVSNAYRLMDSPIIPHVAELVRTIAVTPKDQSNWLLLISSVSALHTPASLAGWLSMHWLPQEVALERAGSPEIQTIARRSGAKEIKTTTTTYYSFEGWEATTQPSR